VDSGARNIDRVLSGTMLPDLSTQLLARMAEGQPVDRVTVDWDSKAGGFSYSIA
jgi:type VI secretion system protein VasG